MTEEDDSCCEKEVTQLIPNQEVYSRYINRMKIFDYDIILIKFTLSENGQKQEDLESCFAGDKIHESYEVNPCGSGRDGEDEEMKDLPHSLTAP